MSSRQSQRPLQSYRARTYELFNPGGGDTWGTRIDWVIMTLIAVNVAAVILETVDPLHARYDRLFRLIEVGSVTVFSVEYIARIWSGVEAKWDETDVTTLSIGERLRDRLRIISRPLLLIDLLAILPFYLSALGLGIDLRVLRSLRLIRFLRLLKLVRYSQSMRAFGHAFRRKKDQLIVALTANGLLLLIASSLMYFIETNAQPDAFGSIPEAMWWGIATLTTVGYGDVTPVTPLGQFVGSIVAVLGIGLFALPASIMASGFIEAASYETHECPKCGYEVNWDDDI